jgi:hypothetical protein
MLLALLLAQAASSETMTPEMFRQGLELQHLCITDTVLSDTGFRELGRLNVERGQNLPDIALIRSRPQDPPHFENGIVASVSIEVIGPLRRWTATINGERSGRPALAVLVIEREGNRSGGITLNVFQDGLPSRRYNCMPTVNRTTPQ